MSQTTYPTEADQGKPGLLGSNEHGYATLSLANEETVGLPFGIMVQAGTDPDNQFLLPSATGQTPLGVLVFNHAIESETLGTNGAGDQLSLSPDETADVLNRGKIWVIVEDSPSPGDDVFFRHTASASEQAGAFRTDADTADADQVTNARWVTSAQGGVAMLELTQP